MSFRLLVSQLRAILTEARQRALSLLNGARLFPSLRPLGIDLRMLKCPGSTIMCTRRSDVLR